MNGVDIKAEQQRIRRAAFKADGLTIRGRVRKQFACTIRNFNGFIDRIPLRRVCAVRGGLNGLKGKARRNARMNILRLERYALGLTARGTRRRMFTHPFGNKSAATTFNKLERNENNEQFDS